MSRAAAATAATSAGSDPEEERGEHEDRDEQALDHHRAVNRARPRTRGLERAGAQVIPEHQRQHQRVEGQAEERDRSECREERRVADVREAGDEHVLRVAGDGRDAADVRAGDEREEVGQRPVSARARQFDEDRREDEADGIVDEERREDAADEDHRDEQQRRLVHALPIHWTVALKNRAMRRCAIRTIMPKSSTRVRKSMWR